MSKIRLGLVGAGGMGQTAHLQNFATIPECEIVALAEGRARTAELVARRWGIPRVYPDHRAMLEDCRLDAVVAIMDYHLHASVVPDILNAGLPLMTEKPIAVRPETGRRLAELAEQKGIPYMVGYMKRSLPAAVEAAARVRRWRESGEAGPMNYLRATMPPGDWVFGIQWGLSAGDTPPPYEGVVPETPPDWMDAGLAGRYDAFVNYYIHQVNLIRYLAGEDYHVIYADRNGAVMIGETESGVTLTLEMKGRGLRNSWEEFYLVSFENGRVDLSVPAPMAQQNGGDVRIYFGGSGDELPRWERPIMPPVWSMLAQARHFIQCVRDGSAVRSPASEAAKDLEVAEQYVRALSRTLPE